MVSEKNNTDSIIRKTDYWLIAGGFIAITLLAWYVIETMFYGHVLALIIEAIIYIITLAIYAITILRPNRVLVTAARTLSLLWITAAVMVAAFVVYFIATFRW